MKNEKLFFAENQLLRERFKVALKEIDKEKIILKIFFIYFDFFIQTRSGTMIGIENHFLGALYTIPIRIEPYLTIWAYFCTKCERVSFLPSKGKNGTFFFKNRKSTSTWLRSMYRYYESKVHTLKMFLGYYYDSRYSKHFLCFFWLQNENYAWFLNKNSIKIFFQVLDITYHDKLLEICFGAWGFISDNAASIWAM